METISLTRKDLYDQVWTETVAAFCLKYDLPEEGVEDICCRLNVPMPGIGHWRKRKQGKRSEWTPLPTESRGTESVVLYKRNDDLLKEEHVRNIKSLLVQAGNTSSDIKPDEKVFDKLIQSTKRRHVQALASLTYLQGEDQVAGDRCVAGQFLPRSANYGPIHQAIAIQGI